MKPPGMLDAGASPRTDRFAIRCAFLTATVMIAHQVAGKAMRDALFLAQFDVRDLPKMVMISAALSVIGVLIMSALLLRHGPGMLIPRSFALSAGLFLVEWWLLSSAPHSAAVVLYLHMGIVGVLLISGFWSVVNERFDPHTGKRRIVHIGAAATLGGVVGGLIAGQVANSPDPGIMLLVLAGMHAICAYGVRGIIVGQTRERRTDADAGLSVGITLLARNRYLLQMGMVVLLGAMLSGLLDYALKSQTTQRFVSRPDLLEFFAAYYAAVGVVTFLVQVGVSPSILNRFRVLRGRSCYS